MTFEDQTADPHRRLAAIIARLEARVEALEARGNVLPVLDADPDPGDPTNDWLLNDGRRRARDAEGRVHEWVPTVDQRPQMPVFAGTPAVSTGWRFWLRGSDNALLVRNAQDTIRTISVDTPGSGSDGGTGSQGGSGSTDPKPPKPQTKTHRTVWSATETGCYCPAHGREGPLYFGGFSGSSHPERRVMIAFNDSDIRAQTDGSVIRKTEVRARTLHAWPNSGVDIRWGGHKVSNLGGSYAANFVGLFTRHWPKVGGDVWREVPKAVGERFRDDKIRGLTIDQPSGSNAYYGQIAGHVDVRITYTR